MYQDSVQSFVRALRAPTDPPRPGDPPKVEIASEAWCTTSFCVPRKAEIILEWCLTRLLKDSTRDSGSNPVLDLRYWKLLHGVCLSVDPENSKTASVGNAWLQPLLNRVPLLPIVLSLLSNSLKLPAQRRDELYLQSSKSLVFLWSLAAPKFALDALLDCFGAVLRVMEKLTVSGEVSGLFEIFSLVTSSLRTALSNVPNKKKFSQAFMTNHIGVWLNLTAQGRTALSPACAEMCDLGFVLLFDADNLKQIADNPRSNPLFDKLRSHISSSPSHLLSALPILMAEFINAMKKRRSLLSTGGSKADTQSSITVFFSFCEDILRAPGLPQTHVWRSRLDLLNVVEDESLFGFGSENAVALLKEELEASVECLATTDNTNIQSAMRCLCVLSRIDHSFVEASTDRILSSFFTIFQSSGGESLTKAAHEFLSLTLSYHAKTRTLPVHISRLMVSCTVPPPHTPSLPVRMSYDELAACPILTTSHLDRLSKAVRAFITPGQTLDTATRVLVMLRVIWEKFRGESVSAVSRERHARKKRRKTGHSERAKEDVDANGVTFVLAARIAATVLSSLPLHSIAEEVQREVQATVKGSLDGYVREATLMGATATVSRDTDGHNIWAAQVVAAAASRLRYSLQSSVQAWHTPDNQSDLEGLFAQVLAVEDCLPEHRVEIFRHLLCRRSHRTVEQEQALFEAVLNFLEVHLPVLQSAPKVWSGRSSQLSYDNDGPAFAAVALLRLVLNRHLDIFNLFASSVQQRRLVNLLHLTPIEPNEGAQCGLSLVNTVYECLHSATFWELGNIRSSFFLFQHEKTAFLDTNDVANIQDGKKRAVSQHAKDRMQEAVKAYTFLLHTPSECLPKSLRGDFLRRAVILDFLLGSATLDSTCQSLQIVRTFLFRALDFLGSWDHAANGGYLHHLMTSSVPISAVRVTEELVQGYLLASFRAAVQGNTDQLLDAIEVCREQTLTGWLFSKESEAPLRSSTQRLMNIVTTEFSTAMFPPDVISRLSTFFEHVLDQLHPILRRLVTTNVLEPDEIVYYTDVLLLWSCTIAFGKYLHRPKNPSPGLGMRIIQAIGPSSLSRGSEDACISKVCGALLAVLVSELQFYSGEEESNGRESHLQHIITTYVVFAPSSAEQCDFDENMARLFRSLSPSDFSLCLEFVVEALSTGEMALEMTARIIYLTSLAMHNAPQHTLKTVQALDKGCLNVFVNNANLLNDHITRLSMLSFISDLCSKRPASVRLQNVMSIWILISKFLAGSKAHDTITDTVLFHHIVSVLSALVRLRRDLVITTLPHLSNIMRQLIFALRSPRPVLGAKQYAIVANTLPVWINPSRPLGAEESKELSRLFTSLSAKTLVRVHGPPAETQNPESLARPLSKHVACVLQAYMDVLNDPLCVLAADVRRELQPGLFVLCDTINHHTRDALMISALDVGGKAAMKDLWREYEKQRYTGKG